MAVFCFAERSGLSSLAKSCHPICSQIISTHRFLRSCCAPQCNEATSKMAASPKLRLHGLFEALPWLDSAQAELPLVGEESKHAFDCFPIFPSNGKKLEKLDVELHGSAILTDQSR